MAGVPLSHSDIARSLSKHCHNRGPSPVAVLGQTGTFSRIIIDRTYGVEHRSSCSCATRTNPIVRQTQSEILLSISFTRRRNKNAKQQAAGCPSIHSPCDIFKAPIERHFSIFEIVGPWPVPSQLPTKVAAARNSTNCKSTHHRQLRTRSQESHPFHASFPSCITFPFPSLLNKQQQQ